MRFHSIAFFTSKSQSKPATSRNKGGLTVGLKLLLGVALASNSCIAALLSINHGGTLRVESMMAEVINIRDEIDNNLRDSIVQLQRQFIALPKLFKNSPTEAILQAVGDAFTIENQRKLAGRNQYGSLYTRTEKRDLTKGNFVVTINNNQLMLSHGLFNDDGTFTNTIEQSLLASQDPQSDRERLTALIAEVMAKSDSVQFYEEKISGLRALVANRSLEAEQSRTQILGFVDRINLQKQRMQQAMDQQQYQSLYAGLAAVFINILALFLLTRIIIERPLGRLAAIVEALSSGQFPEIPWRTRRDQIGVLCAAIDRFRSALLRLQQEEQRKETDQQHVEHLVEDMTETIHGLDTQATEMVQMALTLQQLAGKTEEVSTDVASLADDSAKRTLEVGNSSQQINTAVGDISRELEVQNGEVNQFVGEIGRARQQLDELSRSVSEIDTIVGTVRAITDQTKILALNATIEAVKAGEFGRGFAVVADEVKKLSQDTALATRDVREKIEAINSTCRAFIESFDSLDNGADTLQQVTQTIHRAVERQRSLTGAIVDLSGATGENTREVSTRIAEVNSAAANVLSLSRNTRHHAEDIAAKLGQLLAGSVNELGTMYHQEGEGAKVETLEGVAATTQQPVSGHTRAQRTEQDCHLGLLHKQGVLEGQ
ncbi:MAG: methyl-accepting chemotaxis protein [Desulfobulbus sp.]